MYNVKMKTPENTAPWDIPLFHRIQKLNSYINKKCKIFIILYEAPDTSTFRYRAYNIYQCLDLSTTSNWKSIYFFHKEIEIVKQFFSKIDIISIVRMKWTIDLEQFICSAQHNNIPVLFDIDDMVFDTRYLPLVTNTLNVQLKEEFEYDFWFAYISRLELTASKVNAFITTNQYLAEKLENKFNKNSYIIPNFFNMEQLDFSKKCCLQKRTSVSPFIIGYFSGTPSHINDFGVVALELAQLLDEFPNIKLRIVGFMDFPAYYQKYITRKQVEIIPLVDFLTLQRLIAEVDVNIVPLVENSFTNCKSELKFFEASIVKTITCATPTYVFKNCIQHGENGFLCRPGEWYHTLKNIYQNYNSMENIVNNCYEYSLEHYSLHVMEKKLNYVLEQINL